MKPKIAIVGAGIFGLTAAIKLAENGYPVSIIEKGADILTGASGINQYRMHRGYHYPRSISTAEKCRDSFVSFQENFPESVISDTRQYYCIGSENSLTSAEEFLDFCNKLGLEYSITSDLDIIKSKSVSLIMKVNEGLYDVQILYKILLEKIKSLSINVKFGFKADSSILQKYDFVVAATYCNNNEFIESSDDKVKYQYELCEKPVVKLPDDFCNKGVVVLDGPFMCLDPYGGTGLHVMGHVVHAIHHTSVGFYPKIPDDPRFLQLLNKGVVKDPPISNFQRIISSASKFFEGIESCHHIGSMFTHRVVLPHMEDTDERPTIVRQINDNLITIFSGKITTCIESAHEVLNLLESKMQA